MPPQQPQSREQFIESLFLLSKKDNIYSDKVARESLVRGVDKVVDVIKRSYGAAGSNCVIEADLLPYHKIVNDGKTIADAIKLADSVENIGANIVKEVADKSDRESGDGRKTSMILLQAILKEGMKCKESPMEIKRSLDECLPIIIKSIDDQTQQVTIKDIGKVAEVASESRELGEVFGKIYKEIGKDGIIELDNSGIPDTFYTVTEGVRLLNCGYQYPYMANEDKGRKAVFKAPLVLIVKQKIASIKDLDDILKSVFNKGRNELVIFCDEIDMTVSQSLAFLHQGITPSGDSITPFKTLVIKAPILWKDWLFEDFAKITKATIIDPAQGRTLKNFQFSWLGYCDKIVASKDETVVLGTQDITDYIKSLEEIGTDDAKLRISRLKTKTAILKLGANSESELSYIRAKALDARNASFLALKGGVVKGAGICLDIIADRINNDILKKALKAPANQIIENAGTIATNIFDPAIVVKNSLTNALSVASTILTTNNVITLKK
jgi:chaperonin GroEL